MCCCCNADLQSLTSLPERDRNIAVDLRMWLSDYIRMKATCSILEELQTLQSCLRRHSEPGLVLKFQQHASIVETQTKPREMSTGNGQHRWQRGHYSVLRWDCSGQAILTCIRLKCATPLTTFVVYVCFCRRRHRPAKGRHEDWQ